MRETARYKRKCKIERFAGFAQNCAVDCPKLSEKLARNSTWPGDEIAPGATIICGLTGCVSRDKQRMSSVKCWEIIADNLRKAGVSWGFQVRWIRLGRIIFTADAYARDSRRFAVLSDEKLRAFLEFEGAIRAAALGCTALVR